MRHIFRIWVEGFEYQAMKHAIYPVGSGEPLKYFKSIGVLYANLSSSGIQNRGRVNGDRRPLEIIILVEGG